MLTVSAAVWEHTLASSDELTTPNLPKELDRVQIIAVKVFDVGDTMFSGKCWFRVLHPHSMPGTPRGDTESGSVFADDVSDDFHDFEREPSTVLDRSTAFVCRLVRDVPGELVWEVYVGEVEFDAVESGSADGFVCGNIVPLGVGLDLFDCQRTKGWVGRRHEDDGCADQLKPGVLGLKWFGVRGTTESPKLEEDV